VQPPNELAFWGSVGPKKLKPAAMHAGACVAARWPGWTRRVCGRSDGHAMCRRSGSNNWYQNQVGPVYSQKNLGSQCEGEIVGNSLILCVVEEQA
jgi:hypothetical protein